MYMYRYIYGEKERYTYIYIYICVFIHVHIYTYISVQCEEGESWVNIWVNILLYINMCIYRVDFLPSSAMGWLQLVGSIKLQVSFVKETYERDNILQKRRIILSILLTVATP